MFRKESILASQDKPNTLRDRWYAVGNRPGPENGVLCNQARPSSTKTLHIDHPLGQVQILETTHGIKWRT